LSLIEAKTEKQHINEELNKEKEQLINLNMKRQLRIEELQKDI
jgi:hypothetical protein